MKLSMYKDGSINLKSALWVSFWLYILQAGEPNILSAVVAWLGRV